MRDPTSPYDCINVTSKNLLELSGHDSLLENVAVLFNGQNDGVVGGGKGVLLDTLYDLDKPYFRGEGVAVVDDGLAVCSVPTVHWQQRERERECVRG